MVSKLVLAVGVLTTFAVVTALETCNYIKGGCRGQGDSKGYLLCGGDFYELCGPEANDCKGTPSPHEYCVEKPSYNGVGCVWIKGKDCPKDRVNNPALHIVERQKHCENGIFSLCSSMQSGGYITDCGPSKCKNEFFSNNSEKNANNLFLI